jgi:hypothetical protein
MINADMGLASIHRASLICLRISFGFLEVVALFFKVVVLYLVFVKL